MNAGALDPQSTPALHPVLLWPAPLASVAIDEEEFLRPATLREQPAWARDRALISARARAVLERVRSILVTALGYWDHQRHRITVGSATISIDASGSYRRG